MLYTISNTQIKNNDWKIASVKGADGVEANEVSINRTNKKGEIFPRFDEIADGASIEGNLWKSDAGKNYLFAPKEFKKSGGGNTVAIALAQERKVENITKAQDRTSHSVKVSGTARDATMILTTLIQAGKIEASDWKNQWTIIRNQLLNMYEVETTEGVY